MTNFERILVPIDFGAASERAMSRALALAREFGSKVTLVHVTELPAMYHAVTAEGFEWPPEELEGATRTALDEALALAKKQYANVDARLCVGAAREKIVETAVKEKADLIVVGTHGRRGVMRVLLGSVAEGVVRTSPVPVMTVPA